MKKVKLGMYGEMPIVRIGDMELCQFTDKENETEVWLQITDEEGMQIRGEGVEDLAKVLKDWFNKNF